MDHVREMDNAVQSLIAGRLCFMIIVIHNTQLGILSRTAMTMGQHNEQNCNKVLSPVGPHTNEERRKHIYQQPLFAPC